MTTSDPRDYYDAYLTIVALNDRLNTIEHRGRSQLVSLAGEILVRMKLLEAQVKARPAGGQGPFDIRIVTRTHSRRLEVKTSRSHSKKDLTWHGWQVQRKGKEIDFDFLVCVSLDTSLRNPEFYVFERGDVLSGIDVSHHDRFTGMVKKIELYSSHEQYLQARSSKPSNFSRLEDELNENPLMYKDRWKLIG